MGYSLSIGDCVFAQSIPFEKVHEQPAQNAQDWDIDTLLVLLYFAILMVDK